MLSQINEEDEDEGPGHEKNNYNNRSSQRRLVRHSDNDLNPALFRSRNKDQKNISGLRNIVSPNDVNL